MREIKFRAWALDKDLKMRLVYSDEFKNLEHYFALTDDFKMMQFTGLKDKNGKEIYEGDIVDGGNGIVEFRNGAFGITFENKFFTFDTVIEGNKKIGVYSFPFGVIGNIYENPELIKSKI